MFKISLAGLLLGFLGTVVPANSGAQTETLDDLYKNALKKAGPPNYYSTLAQINAEKILPQFEKRLPGIESITSMPRPTSLPRARLRKRATVE